MTPEEDRFWRIVLLGVWLALLGAFAPQIMALLRRLGYRGWTHSTDTSWKRGAAVIGIAVALTALALWAA